MFDAITAIAAVSVLCYWAYLYGHRRGERQTWDKATEMLNHAHAEYAIRQALGLQGMSRCFQAGKTCRHEAAVSGSILVRYRPMGRAWDDVVRVPRRVVEAAPVTVYRCTECGLRGDSRDKYPRCMCYAPLEPVEMIAVGVAGCTCGGCSVDRNSLITLCKGSLMAHDQGLAADGTERR